MAAFRELDKGTSEKKSEAEEKQRLLIGQLIKTQAECVQAFSTLQSGYINTVVEPLRQNEATYGASPSDVAILEMGLGELAGLPTRFRKELVECEIEDLEPVICKHVSLFGSYGEYLEKLEQALVVLERLENGKQKPKVKKLLEAMEKKFGEMDKKLTEGGQDKWLLQLLLLPINKMFEVVNLLEGFFELGNQSEALKATHSKLLDICDNISQRKGKLETKRVQIRLKETPPGFTWPPDRMLVFEGKLKAIMENFSKKASLKVAERYVYLFTDKVVVAQVNQVYRYDANLASLAIEVPEDTVSDFVLTNSSMCIGFRCEDQEERAKWVQQLQTAKEASKDVRRLRSKRPTPGALATLRKESAGLQALEARQEESAEKEKKSAVTEKEPNTAAGSTEDVPVSEQEESHLEDVAMVQKLKKETDRANDIATRVGIIETFMHKLRKRIVEHAQAYKKFCESTKRMAGIVNDFYHYANNDPPVVELSDRFHEHGKSINQDLVRNMERENATTLGHLAEWSKDAVRVKEKQKLRESAKRNYVHYMEKLRELTKNSKKGVVESGKKQTQVKRNRLKLDDARKVYEKCASDLWAAFDVCWDGCFSRLNPSFAQLLRTELSVSEAHHKSLSNVNASLGPALQRSNQSHRALVDQHEKTLNVLSSSVVVVNERSKKGEEPSKRDQIDSNPNDMLATALEGDIAGAIQSVSSEELCDRLSVVGSVLSLFPRQAAINALAQRSQSPQVLQGLGFLKECGIVRPPELLNDMKTSRDLVDFFLAFQQVISVRDAVLGLDFKVPPNSFHPFQVSSPLRRFVIIKEFVSNAKPVLLAAFSEYQENVKPEPEKPPVVVEGEAGMLAPPGAVGQRGSESRSRSISRESSGTLLDQPQKKWWELLDQRTRLPDFIFKYGDDLRTDQACLHVFRLMNHLWKSSNIELKSEFVQAKVYKIQPINSKMGLVEFVPGCTPLSAMSKETAYGLSEQKIARLVATSAAGYIGAYILGIKDRHSDNILITEDSTVFHIDFGHVLGNGVTIDTGPFAITPELKEILEQWYSWHVLVDLCERAFLVLREHAEVVSEYASLLLSPVFPDIDVVAFCRKKLMVDVPAADATAKLRKLLRDAPSHYKTRLKNFVHGANQGIQKRTLSMKNNDTLKFSPSR